MNHKITEVSTNSLTPFPPFQEPISRALENTSSTLSSAASTPSSCCCSLWRCLRKAVDFILSYIEPVIFIVKQALCCLHLPNLKPVNAEIYRGAQPSKKGFTELQAQGIKCILNLRQSNSEQALVESLGMKSVFVPMDYEEIKWEDVVTLGKTIVDNSNYPLFIHCFYGADRTGFACVLVRLLKDNWTKEQALDEMVNGGFGCHSFRHPNLIDFLKDLDLEKLKSELHSN